MGRGQEEEEGSREQALGCSIVLGWLQERGVKSWWACRTWETGVLLPRRRREAGRGCEALTATPSPSPQHCLRPDARSQSSTHLPLWAGGRDKRGFAVGHQGEGGRKHGRAHTPVFQTKSGVMPWEQLLLALGKVGALTTWQRPPRSRGVPVLWPCSSSCWWQHPRGHQEGGPRPPAALAQAPGCHPPC